MKFEETRIDENAEKRRECENPQCFDTQTPQAQTLEMIDERVCGEQDCCQMTCQEAIQELIAQLIEDTRTDDMRQAARNGEDTQVRETQVRQ